MFFKRLNSLKFRCKWNSKASVIENKQYERENIIYYKLDNYYNPSSERGIIWNDKSLNIKWPSKKPIVSLKDKSLKTFKESVKRKIFF